MRFELMTPPLPWACSTTELSRPSPTMVLEVGLEPTKAEAGRFTVSCHCH